MGVGAIAPTLIRCATRARTPAGCWHALQLVGRGSSPRLHVTGTLEGRMTAKTFKPRAWLRGSQTWAFRRRVRVQAVSQRVLSDADGVLMPRVLVYAPGWAGPPEPDLASTWTRFCAQRVARSRRSLIEPSASSASGSVSRPPCDTVAQCGSAGSGPGPSHRFLSRWRVAVDDVGRDGQHSPPRVGPRRRLSDPLHR